MESIVQTTTTLGGKWSTWTKRSIVMILPLIALLWGNSLQAQYFQLYAVDASNFPKMSARFVAQDAAGTDYLNVSNNEFDLVENGIVLNTTATYVCKDTSVPPAANVVMILDRSGSMGTIVDTATKKDRMSWVISGATSFLNTFKFVPPSEVAVISFGTIPTFESPFRNTAPPLVNVISKLKPQGGTEYNPPLLDTSFGAIKLLSLQEPTVRRIIIFLTDGQPDHTPSRDSIITLCNRYAIQFYAITIGTQMNPDLKQIANSTGGKSFEAYNEEDLVAIYRLIALQTEIKKVCTVNWTAPYSCNQSGRVRDVKVSFKRTTPPLVSTTTYLAPLNSVASVNLSSSTLYFGDPAPNGTTTQKVTIKPVNAPLKIDSLVPTPAGFFTVIDINGGKSTPLTVNAGDSLVLTLQFKQGAAKGYRQASLVAFGSPCPPLISMFGGLSSVRVLSPSGDVANTCDSINIKWAGVEPTQGVNIFVAQDGDSPNPTWVPIKLGATGLSYKWKPNIVGKKLRIKITAAPPATYLWTRSLGGPMLDTTRSIALDKSQFFVHVAGTMNDTMRVSSSSKWAASNGAKDAFVARFDSDGNLIWVESAGGNADEGNCGVATDSKDGIYVAGYFTSKAVQFGSTQLTLPANDQCNMFVAKYGTDGNVNWVRTGGGTATGTGYAYSDSIAVDNDTIYVYGRFKSKIRISGTQTSPGYLELNTTSTALQKFIAAFDRNGNLLSLVQGYKVHSYTTTTQTDSKGNLYDCGSFKGTQNNGGAPVNLTSRGDFDAFVRKFGGQPGSSDSSANLFTVSSPVLSFKTNLLVLPKISVGLSSDSTFNVELCNTGDIPLLIAANAVTLTGANPGDFKITSNYDNQVFYPGDCQNIEIKFIPTAEGTRTATLSFASVCGNPATVELQGTALPPCKFESSQPYIGAQSINLTKDVGPLPCIIRNNSASPNGGKISLGGLNPDEFVVDFTGANAATLTYPNTVNFTLQANKDCLPAIIHFTPKGSGQRTAILHFDVPTECGLQQEIALIGFGLAAQVNVDSVPFGLRRKLTTTPLPCTIKNNDSLDANITAIALATADPHFRIVPSSLPSLPYKLVKGSSTTIQVEFTPQAEGPFSNYVNVTVDGSVTPIQGLVSGEGFVPQITAADVVFPAAPVGSTNPPQQLTIRNSHLRAPLLVKSVANPTNGTVFGFASPKPGANLTLLPDSSYVIDVSFVPAAGMNIGYVDIISDAKEGPLLSPDTLLRVKLSGEGLQVAIDPQPAGFGDVLSCDSTQTRSVTITNNSANAITVDISATGDTSAFVFNPAASTITLQPGASQSYVVIFRGTPGSHLASLVFDLPTGKVTRDFSANGVTATMNVNTSDLEYSAGDRKDWKADLVIPTLTNVIVNRLAVRVSFDSTKVLFDTQKFKTTYNNWTWAYSPEQRSAGSWVVTGTNATGVTGGTVSCYLPLQLLNPTVDLVPVTVAWSNTTDYPCIVSKPSTSNINVKRGCYSDGSQVIPTKTPYSLQVSPNPLNGTSLLVEYGIGFDKPYAVEVYNTIGERVATIDQGTNSGFYRNSVDLSSLSTGVYYVRLSTDGTIQTRVLSIGR